MKDEKAAFSERLREAMRRAGYEPRPTVLEKLFNTHYSAGRPVTSQAVSGWLGARNIPKQDKLQVIARLLDTEAHVLRYGGTAATGVKEPRASWGSGISAQDRALVDALLSLPPARKKLISEMIRNLTAKTPAG